MSDKRERPIIFTADSVRAILDGRKTQTRRVVKPQPGILMENVLRYNRGEWPCPYGEPGDRLWVRETWAPSFHGQDCIYAADPWVGPFPFTGKWKSSLFMPRWASRITLEIVSIRAERVQDITEADAIAEGVHNEMDIVWQTGDDTPIGMFGELWDSINAKRGYSWDSNPWVWVIEFRRYGHE